MAVWRNVHACSVYRGMVGGCELGVEIRVDVYSSSHMIRILGTIFAGLMGLAFGSFLNVCLSRWPAGESVVKPRSHWPELRSFARLVENVPLVSW